MTGREWQPGDVMVATWATIYGEPVVHFMVDGCNNSDHHDEPHWHDVRGGWSSSLTLAADVRPLVVIDPEDREQVERLLCLFHQADQTTPAGMDRMQAALREFVTPTPPKPNEPTDMWSVVVDRAGDQWVRALGPDFTDGWVRAGDLPSNGKWTDYRQIDAVAVVRSGVQDGEPS
ncbi:hypothetical protein F9L07_19530 [Pimelobacter simplex]|uniref:Uncharacterized protein n=1 Tax=Nocardioides simplex TaxID=2045 RepID=A0A7J5DV82_NOCSI|nr:hypothetical protein [Pimelobacter simplex]KAB2809234.1 hypothetical protein F9L07_19530 [Pimelobacter simplex]